MTAPPLDLSALNPNQREAVNWAGGGLLVLAGPGSGKTKVLTLRVAKLLLDSPGATFRILGLTFTKKAASEMRQRVAAVVRNPETRVRLTTFHSFAVDLLRLHGSHLGLRPDFQVVEEFAEREAVMADALAGVAGVRDSVPQLLRRVERLAERGLDRDAVDAECAKARDTFLPRIYRRYLGCLLKRQSLDYPALILSAVTVLRQVPAVATLVRTIYPYVCVDEFQDTNEGQYRLLQHLVGADAARLFLVADDDQLIYAWRGANPERLAALQRDFRIETIQLPTNYRCPPPVITLANRLIVQNASRTPGKQALVADKTAEAAETIRVRDFATASEEVAWLVQDLAGRCAAAVPRCAVLGRTKRLLEPVVEKLRAAGVPAVLVARRDQFVSAPARWLHATLSLRHRDGDRRHLARACGAFQQLTGSTVDAKQIETTLGPGDTLLDGLFDAYARLTTLPATTGEFLARARTHLLTGSDFLSLCRETWQWCDACDDMSAPGFQDYAEERDAWITAQAEIVRQFGAKDLRLGIFLQELAVGARLPPVADGTIQCMTIHGAKGLEFEHVYVMGLAEELLPLSHAIQRGSASDEMQEERRGCFVAITRTETTLTLTRAASYDGRPRRQSRFLAEMDL